MTENTKDKKILWMFRISIFFLISSLILCILVFRDINRSKENYLKSQEIITLNDDLDFLLQNIVFQSLRNQYQIESTLIRDQVNTINSKIFRLGILVKNQLPNEFLVREIDENWKKLLSLNDFEKFNRLYDLESLQNSLYVNASDSINFNLLATSKNIKLLSAFSVLTMTLAFIFFLMFYNVKKIKIA